MVKVITDSVSDIPEDVARDLDITVIPLVVNFGNESFQDRVELTSEQFYDRLENGPLIPKTSAPSPGVFGAAFDKAGETADELLGIFLSRKLSATYDVATAAVDLMKKKCNVEIMDSTSAIMGQGMLVIEAARKAMEGLSLAELINVVENNIPKIHVRATLPTLKYLYRGGRIGKIQSLLGSLLNINPVIGIKDGIAFPFAKTRSRNKAIAKIYEYINGLDKLKSVAVEYGKNTDEAGEIVAYIKEHFPGIPVYLSNVSPVIGTHTGPGILTISVLEA
jgi:DegV family protein with EDD domain